MRSEYFDGCHNVKLPLPLEPPVLGPLTPTPNLTLADAVQAAERRRADDGQLCLPAELMPVPTDRLFA